MHSRLLVLAVVVGASSSAVARPTADVVIVWAPGASVAPLGAVARDAGVAMIDRSPAGRAASTTGATITRAIAEFDALHVDEATKLLDEAKTDVDNTGAADITQTQLSDLFLYRARIASDRGDSATAWEGLTTAVIVAPTRVFDPGRFSPSVRAELDRARATVDGRPKAALAVSAPGGCRVTIDGAPAAQAPYVIGPHWVHVACADREPWGTRVELVAADIRIEPRNIPIAAPTDDELLVQARAVAARAFVGVRVQGGVAILRLVGSDGRELDHRTVRIDRDLAPAAASLKQLLAASRGVGSVRRWYQSPLFWGIVGASVATAIVLPLALTNDPGTTFTVAPESPWGGK